jgi:hypothetical protein
VCGLAVTMSGYRCQEMGCLYLGKDRGVRVWAGCI